MLVLLLKNQVYQFEKGLLDVFVLLYTCWEVLDSRLFAPLFDLLLVNVAL